jgi:hypothetical protein
LSRKGECEKQFQKLAKSEHTLQDDQRIKKETQKGLDLHHFLAKRKRCSKDDQTRAL